MIDCDGKSTSFTYRTELCGLDSYTYDYHSSNIMHYTYSYAKSYYNYLTGVEHPSGATTSYNYKKSDKYITYPIIRRQDTDMDGTFNSTSYSFDFESRKSTADYGKKTIEYAYNDKGFITKETVKSSENIKEWVDKVYDNKLGLPTKVITNYAAPGYGSITWIWFYNKI